MKLFEERDAKAIPTREQVTHVQSVIDSIWREEYYLSLWDSVRHTKPLSGLTLDELLKPFQDFWDTLPESKAIRRGPFFAVCDLAEAYCFDLIHEVEELAHELDTPDTPDEVVFPPMIHELKILPEYFKEVESGAKKFELRRDDRDYRVGDTLILRGCDEGEYTGRSVARKVSYKFTGPGYGLESGFCILSLEELK